MNKLSFFAALSLVAVFISSKAMGHEPLLEEDKAKKQRYQIFIAEHNAIVRGNSVSMKSIFKIDLETGTVWRYRQGVDSKGKPYEEFFEVPNQ
ncbi:MAG: hypothetical protein OEZ68_06185 [Gammaproteobacteria bacterium]|nr:hypothetical protein [Gammaproteobacteria bacterium]MDH5800378.1 hypothetical protein [Gammaproteobacteria bacterium]